MRSAAGQEECDHCSGKGCYHCQRRGYTVQCPGCANDGLETITQDGDEFLCVQCGTTFGKSGDVIKQEEPEVPEPKSPYGKPNKR